MHPWQKGLFIWEENMELKKTLIMNKGDFEMRANLAQKEPTYVKHWSEMDLYHNMLEKNDGREAI